MKNINLNKLLNYNDFLLLEKKSFFDLVKDNELIKKLLKEFGLESNIDNYRIAEQSKDSIRYKVDDKHSLIFTTEFSEAETAHRLSKKSVTKHIINTYDVRIIKGGFLEKYKKTLYVILCDYYVNLNNEDSKIIHDLSTNLDLYSLLEEDYMDEYMIEHVVDNYDENTVERIAMLITEIKSILLECKKLKLSYPILNPNYFGWNDGNLMLINIMFQTYYNVGAAKDMKVVDIKESILNSPLKGKNLLYHSTSYSRAIDILNDNEIFEASKQAVKTSYSKNHPHYNKSSEDYSGVSLTRNPNYKFEDVQFILNADLLKQDYGKKLKPYDFFNSLKHPLGKKKFDLDRRLPMFGYNDESSDFESEEFLSSNIKPLDKYLIGIRFRNMYQSVYDFKDEDLEGYEMLKELVSKYDLYDESFKKFVLI